MDAEQILDVLIATTSQHCIWATELAFSSGRNRADFWTLHCQSGKNYQAIAYEIKVSRADFRRDSHKKQREARLFSDQFYYVTPPGLIKLEEVPDWAGLIEIHGETRKHIHSAPIRDKDMPSWELVVSIIRNSGIVRRDEDVRLKRLRHLEAMVKDADRKLKDAGLQSWQYGIHT